MSQSETDHSGSWYNPARNGEGFHIQFLEADQALVIWFTYPGTSDNAQTEQAWILGIGEVVSGKIIVTDAIKASGPVFGEDYDKEDVARTIWGDISVTFSGPDNGMVKYDGLDGAGTTQITRITTLADSAISSSLPAGISGAWFDPATDGQGWFVEILSPSAALVYWFTYDQNGNQAWNLGVGTIYANKVVLSESRSGKGTFFGTAFKPEDIEQVLFGMLTLEFHSCSTGRMAYLLANGAEAGTFPLERLTSLESRQCTSLPVPTPAQKVMSNLADPLATQYDGLDNIQMNLFGKKTASGSLGRLSSGNIQTATGGSILFTLNPAGQLTQIQDSSSGITLTSEVGGNGDVQTVLNDPENSVSAGIGSETTVPSSTTKSSNPGLQSIDGDVHDLEADDGGTAVVSVELCGKPATDAQVNFLIKDETGSLIAIPASQVEPGRYQSGIPTSLEPEVSDDVLRDVCATTTQQFAVVCDAVTGAGTEPGLALSSEICLQLGTQIGAANPDAAVNAAAVCTSATAAFVSACAANALRAADCGPAPSKVYRDFAGVQISAEATVPGLHTTATTGPLLFDNPAEQLVFPTVVIPGEPYYLGHSVMPAIPKAGDAYTVDLNVGCVDQGQVLTINNMTTGASRSCSMDAQGGCQVELSSNYGDGSNVLEITGPGGLHHQLVQGLANPASEGFGDGIWRAEFYDDADDVTLLGAVAIKHPDAYLCDFTNGEFGEVERVYFTWDQQKDFYISEPIEDGISAGIRIEGGDNLCIELFGSDVIERGCFPVTKSNSWAEATRGDFGVCATPPDFP